MNDLDENPNPEADRTRELGQLLRDAREAAGLSVREMADHLRLTTTAVNDLEAGDWDKLGARVYLRGYLKAYGRRLGVDVAGWTVNLPVAESMDTEPELPRRPRHSKLGGYGRYASYALATALLAVPAVLGVIRAFDQPVPVAEPAREQVEPSDEPKSEAPRLASMASLPVSRREAVVEDSPQAAESREPEQAGAASEPVHKPAPARFVVELREAAWMAVTAETGEQLVYGLQEAGSRHEFPVTDRIHVRLGNADAVIAQLDGESFDLAPFMTRDVADFDLLPGAPEPADPPHSRN